MIGLPKQTVQTANYNEQRLHSLVWSYAGRTLIERHGGVTSSCLLFLAFVLLVYVVGR